MHACRQEATTCFAGARSSLSCLQPADTLRCGWRLRCLDVAAALGLISRTRGDLVSPRASEFHVDRTRRGGAGQATLLHCLVPWRGEARSVTKVTATGPCQNSAMPFAAMRRGDTRPAPVLSRRCDPRRIRPGLVPDPPLCDTHRERLNPRCRHRWATASAHAGN